RAADGSVPFTIQTRADLISERMANALEQAGCAEAWIGAESGSQRVLDAMTKGTKVADLIAARMRLGERGIRVGFFIQLGYLGEQLADLLATRELVTQAAPGDSGDLAMMFRGAYDSDFYRRVRDLLHEQVTLQQAKAAMEPERYRQDSAALDARWHALIACEQAHRNEDATAPPTTEQDHPQALRHAATAQNR